MSLCWTQACSLRFPAPSGWLWGQSQGLSQTYHPPPGDFRVLPITAPAGGIQEQAPPLPQTCGTNEAVWKEKVSCPRSRSGNCQDSAPSSTHKGCLGLSVPLRNTGTPRMLAFWLQGGHWVWCELSSFQTQDSEGAVELSLQEAGTTRAVSAACVCSVCV